MGHRSERKLSGLDGAAYALEVLRPFGRERTGQAKITLAKDRCGYVRQHEGPGKTVALFELESWPDGKVSAPCHRHRRSTRTGRSVRR